MKLLTLVKKLWLLFSWVNFRRREKDSNETFLLGWLDSFFPRGGLRTKATKWMSRNGLREWERVRVHVRESEREWERVRVRVRVCEWVVEYIFFQFHLKFSLAWTNLLTPGSPASPSLSLSLSPSLSTFLSLSLFLSQFPHLPWDSTLLSHF